MKESCFGKLSLVVAMAGMAPWVCTAAENQQPESPSPALSGEVSAESARQTSPGDESAATPGESSKRETAPAPAPGYSGRNFPPAQLDPESYDYWWYYYAYPRSLAYANERLLSSYPPYYYSSFYPYAYPPLPFYPYSFTTFSHPNRFRLHGHFSR